MAISKEFKKHLRIGLTAAVGFVIAVAWQESIMIYMTDLVEKTTPSTSKIQITSISALTITFFGVILIWGFSKILK